MKEIKKWESKIHSYQIADTGDYSDPEIEFTNGQISLFTKDEIEDCEVDFVIEKLNEIKEVNFYLDDSLTFENQMLEQEIAELNKKIKGLKLEVESFKTLITNEDYVKIDYQTMFWEIFENDFDEEHKLYNKLRSFTEEFHSFESDLSYDETETYFVGDNKILITFSESGGQNESNPDGWVNYYEIIFDYQKGEITNINYQQC
jgi:hypothetical protein